MKEIDEVVIGGDEINGGRGKIKGKIIGDLVIGLI